MEVLVILTALRLESSRLSRNRFGVLLLCLSKRCGRRLVNLCLDECSQFGFEFLTQPGFDPGTEPFELRGPDAKATGNESQQQQTSPGQTPFEERLKSGSNGARQFPRVQPAQ